MSPAERSWAKESARDQDESAFTPILRRLLYRTTGVLAVGFVDRDGETIDYCSALPPFDAKVTGAHMLIIFSDLAERMRTLDAGESWLLHVQGDDRELVARRVHEEYLLVVVLKPRAMTRRMLGGIEQTITELRREAGISTPEWEPVHDSVRVEVREAVGWPYAPAAFVAEAGERVEIDDVLGRWIDGTGRYGRVCFRVRTVAGQELTLVHDRALDRWERYADRD